jgi:hypothetical protein
VAPPADRVTGDVDGDFHHHLRGDERLARRVNELVL